MASGTRPCSIYESIDALEARTVADLTRQLKPILNALAYYAVTGEAAVLETREEWHSQYADALYHATASDHSVDRRAPAPAPASAPARSRAGKNAPEGGAPRRPRGQAAPPSNRPRPGDIPPSLRAIMEGSHPSLKNEG